MFWIFDMYVCIPNNQFQIYELTFWNHILGRLHQRLNTIKRKIIEGLKRRIKRNKFDKDSNAHLILRLHLLHLLNCFWWWWWWCWWVQLILFFIFSPPFTSWWMSSLCTSDASSQSHSGCTHTHNSFYLYRADIRPQTHEYHLLTHTVFLSLQYLFTVFGSSTLYYNTLRRIN